MRRTEANGAESAEIHAESTGRAPPSHAVILGLDPRMTADGFEDDDGWGLSATAGRVEDDALGRQGFERVDQVGPLPGEAAVFLRFRFVRLHFVRAALKGFGSV